MGTLRFGAAGLVSDHAWMMLDGLRLLPQVELVSAAEWRHPELLARARERYGMGGLYEDYEAMLRQEKLDAVLLCSDNKDKPGVVKAAARAGCHVLCDKPMGATLRDAEAMLRSARSAEIKLMIAYHMWFEGMWQEAARLLRDSAIGRVFFASAVVGHAGPRAFGCSQYFCEWLFDRKRNGGGAFMDEACYLINLLLETMGPVQSVAAMTSQVGDKPYLPSNVEDIGVCLLRFHDGALAKVAAAWGLVGGATWGEKKSGRVVSFHGTHGTLESTLDELRLYQAEPERAAEGQWQTLPMRRDRGIDGSEQRYFVERVQSRSLLDDALGPTRARDVQEVIEAVYLSATSGRVVKLPLERESA